ncbi:MAG: hypothetical protein H0V59_01130 [Nocardioidaceae bacterium]|jgi:hypothetical protein|nr:hypothetical protein [Nocardioidaceae bacterium]
MEVTSIGSDVMGLLDVFESGEVRNEKQMSFPTIHRLSNALPQDHYAG